jgi:cell division protein FtsW
LTGLRANLFFVSLGLSLLGLVMVYSATYREFGTQYLWLRCAHVAVGVVAFFLASRVRYTAWRRYAPVLYLAVLVCLVLVLIPGIGTEVGGARRWLDFGPLSVQPGEFAKLAAVLMLGCAVARVPPGSGLPLRPLAAVGVLFVLVLVEPDFGTSVVILAAAAGVLWASELRTGDLVLSAVAAFVALLGVMWLAPYRRERFITFLDPWAVADGSGYQVVQSMVAIKAGGFFGSGAGAGAQGTAVPELGTDMIFALIGEELGLLGMVVVIAAFGFLTLAGFRISLRAPTVLSRCVAAGLTTMLAVQAIFNMGAAMVVLPLAGMTLPFISYGGSSLMVCFAAVGILYRISEDGERAREAKPRARKKTANTGRRRGYGGARDTRALRGG